ncbi:MAG: DUF2064 domain-containing protein [Gelidibacter sp.]
MENQKTAILIFANSGQQESFAKPFKSSALLFDELNNHTLHTVKTTGLPYFHISEKEQMGNSFAERFNNAIQSIYAKGFETVISVGNDTPHLKTSQIREAALQLETKDIVLGPSLDGGFYLMGLKKSLFKAETFLKLPWQTSRLSQSIYQFIDDYHIQLFKLEMLSDIDSVSDIKFILQSGKYLSSSLKKIFSELISQLTEANYSYRFHNSNSFQNSYFNKGSPELIHI